MPFWRTCGWWLLDIFADLHAYILVFVHRRPPALYATGEAAKPVVVFLPGKGWGYMKPLGDVLSRAGYRVEIVPAASNTFGNQRISDTAALVTRHVRERGLSGVVCIGHSRGGLVGKYLLADPDIGSRVIGVIAISTPFAGSRFAALVPSQKYRELLPGSSLLRSLNTNTEVNARIVSIAPSFDNLVSQESMRLEGARNISLTTGGHHTTLFTKECADAVLEALRIFEK